MNDHARDFYAGYLWGYLMMLSFPVGALGVRLVHALTGGQWGLPLRKYGMAANRTWGMAAALALPLVFGFRHLYTWSGGPAVQKLYLNEPFFALRAVVYFAVWTGGGAWLDRPVRGRDVSGLWALAFVLAGSFAGIDWVMSLDPRWYSTIFGLLYVVGQVLTGFCVLICLYVFKDHPPGQGSEEKTLRDLGNLLLMLVMLWAYLAFSQFLIIWMGNLPEEIRWYLSRIKGGWGLIAAGLIAGHFFLPFFVLLRRGWKQTPRFLGAVAIWVLVMRALDMAWMVFPGLQGPAARVNALHVACAGLVIFVYAAHFSKCLRETA